MTPSIRRVRHKNKFPKEQAVHRVQFQSTFTKSLLEGGNVAGNAAQPRERTAALTALGRRAASRIWGSFKDSGLKLESRYQKPLFTDVSGKWATIAVFPWSSHS